MFVSKLIPGFLCAIAASAALTPPPLYQQHYLDRAQVSHHHCPEGGAGEAGPCGSSSHSSGYVNLGSCYPLESSAVSVEPLAERNCEYIIFSGSDNCDSYHSVVTKHSLLAGGQAQCIPTGIEDGGSQEASALLVCGSNLSPRSTKSYKRMKRSIPSRPRQALPALATVL